MYKCAYNSTLYCGSLPTNAQNSTDSLYGTRRHQSHSPNTTSPSRGAQQTQLHRVYKVGRTITIGQQDYIKTN